VGTHAATARKTTPARSGLSAWRRRVSSSILSNIDSVVADGNLLTPPPPPPPRRPSSVDLVTTIAMPPTGAERSPARPSRRRRPARARVKRLILAVGAGRGGSGHSGCRRRPHAVRCVKRCRSRHGLSGHTHASDANTPACLRAVRARASAFD